MADDEEFPFFQPLSVNFLYLEIDSDLFSHMCNALAACWIAGLCLLIVVEVSRTVSRVAHRNAERTKLLPMVELSGANATSERTRYYETVATHHIMDNLNRNGTRMGLLTNVTRPADQEGMFYR